MTMIEAIDSGATVEFPSGFAWGAATASYQIEGAATEGGRGESIWDRYSHTPGNVLNGDTGDVACDHYHRLADDVALMSDLGLDVYRFSIAWPRLQPNGRGELNQAGVDFYNELIERLLAANIRPWVTLYHWDLPQTLEDAGGWPHRDTAKRFADYAAATHEAFADRVDDWTTLNEPWCSAFLGYASGRHAPGRRDAKASIAAAHHLMYGHGLAVQAMRANGGGHQLGITLNLYPITPDTDSAEDRDVARRLDRICNRWFLDPLLRGAYPDDSDGLDRELSAVLADGDLATIAEPIDVLGVNYYTRNTVRAGRPDDDPDDHDPAWVGATDAAKVTTGRPTTAMGWDVDPEGLGEVLGRLHDEYPAIPLYITENGAAYDDAVEPDGTVDDPRRLDYIDAHLRVAERAIAAGVDLRGYFAWSLLDNFEWGFGYSKRFGLVHVDFATQQRTIKNSGHWYTDVIANNAVPARE